MFTNAQRLKAIISKAKTEQEIILLLRAHKIKYSFTTETGFLNIRVPLRKGCFRIYKIASRSAPFVIRFDPGKSVPYEFNY